MNTLFIFRASINLTFIQKQPKQILMVKRYFHSRYVMTIVDETMQMIKDTDAQIVMFLEVVLQCMPNLTIDRQTFDKFDCVYSYHQPSSNITYYNPYQITCRLRDKRSLFPY